MKSWQRPISRTVVLFLHLWNCMSLGKTLAGHAPCLRHSISRFGKSSYDRALSHWMSDWKATYLVDPQRTLIVLTSDHGEKIFTPPGRKFCTKATTPQTDFAVASKGQTAAENNADLENRPWVSPL